MAARDSLEFPALYRQGIQVSAILANWFMLCVRGIFKSEQLDFFHHYIRILIIYFFHSNSNAVMYIISFDYWY